MGVSYATVNLAHLDILLKQSHGKLKLEREQRELDPWDATVLEAHQSFFFLSVLRWEKEGWAMLAGLLPVLIKLIVFFK